MECFDSRGNFPVKVVHLQRWSSLTSRSGPVRPKLAFPFPRIILSSSFLLRRNQKFGRNANGSLRFDWKHYFSRIMSCHFLLIISLVFDWFDMESSHHLGYISSTQSTSVVGGSHAISYIPRVFQDTAMAQDTRASLLCSMPNMPYSHQQVQLNQVCQNDDW